MQPGHNRASSFSIYDNPLINFFLFLKHLRRSLFRCFSKRQRGIENHPSPKRLGMSAVIANCVFMEINPAKTLAADGGAPRFARCYISLTYSP
jgi:hypothetical protein